MSYLDFIENMYVKMNLILQAKHVFLLYILLSVLDLHPPIHLKKKKFPSLFDGLNNTK